MLSISHKAVEKACLPPSVLALNAIHGIMKSREVEACIPRPSNYIKTKDQPEVGK